MAITITRRFAQQLRSVLRRAFGSRSLGPAVCFTAAAGTLTARASTCEIAVEYSGLLGHNRQETLWLPFQLLNDCEGKKDEPVEIKSAGKGRVTAQWRDGNVPQILQYDAAEPARADKFPPLPKNFAENGPQLLQALADAHDTCDPEAMRFALGSIQLRGQPGSITATDGRQLLVQGGFTFPWQESLLIPRSKVFASPELRREQVLVGKAADWVAVRIGPWTVCLRINKEGRFPDLSRHIPRPADATTRCRLSAADARFLADTLPRLPCHESYNYPVTLDLNGSIAIRARATDQPRPTEVLLTASESSGAPVRLNTNRKYLARAVKLGFQEILVYGDKIPVLCQDDRRQYVWALLGPETAIPPAKDAIRIESPRAGTEIPASKPKILRRSIPMTKTIANTDGPAPSHSQTNTSGQAKAPGQARKLSRRRAEQHDVTGLIEQAEKLRAALRDVLLKTNGLVKALKQQRRQSRLVATTLASLRQLQKVAG